jgi:uncharacterized protein
MMATHDEADGEVFAAYPTAPITQHNIAHYRARLERRLLVNRCEECGRWHHPPRPMCPSCWSTVVNPQEVSGRGVIDLLTLLHVGAPAEGIDYGKGHLVGAVALEEQPSLRISAAIVDDSPGTVKVGTPVRLTWIVRSGAGPVPAFEREAMT